MKFSIEVLEEKLWKIDYAYSTYVENGTVSKDSDTAKENREKSEDLKNALILLRKQIKPIRYECLLCGRDKFTRKTPHKCLSGYRKRGLKWKLIYN